jgi:hypothetical protein
MTLAAQKTSRPIILLLLRVYSLSRERVYRNVLVPTQFPIQLAQGDFPQGLSDHGVKLTTHLQN